MPVGQAQVAEQCHGLVDGLVVDGRRDRTVGENNENFWAVSVSPKPSRSDSAPAHLREALLCDDRDGGCVME